MKKRETHMAKASDLYIPLGFVAGGISAGIKASGAPDLGIILCDAPAVAAAITTINRFPAAPIVVCRQRLAPRPWVRGVIVNSGNANAMTGQEGLADALAMTVAAEKATGSMGGSFLVASTGIIGQRLPIARLLKGVPKLVEGLSPKGWLDFADAIQTTDLRRKMSSRKVDPSDPKSASILGIAKGVGMMEPNMATLLAFLVTDYPLAPSKARRVLQESADESFNCLTVDGQMSTNDMALLLSSSVGERSGRRPLREEAMFREALTEVCRDLARQIASDGEGATKLVSVIVQGTNTGAQARRLAKEVANSNLVKTAIFGENPNWGRIIQALGQSPVPFSPDRVSVTIQGMRVVDEGAPCDGARAELRKAMRQKDISINISVGGGKGKCEVWTCDLSKEYVRINAEYN